MKEESTAAARGMIDHYNILIIPSSEYFNQSLVVMLSAIKNCKLPCHFYILHCSWSDDQKEECIRFIDRYPDNKVDFIEFSESDFKGLNPWKGRLEPYAKMLSHLYLPQDVDRVLYLDCDLIVNKDIFNLYSMDFEENYLIACTDTLTKEIYITYLTQIGIYKRGAFNSGVILFNLNKFREDNIDLQVYLDALKRIGNQRYLADQGLLSYVFLGKFKVIPSYKYNHVMFQEGDIDNELSITYKNAFAMSFEERKKYLTEPYWTEIFDENENETIIHYCGFHISKPWTCDVEYNNKIKIISIPNINKSSLSLDIALKFYQMWWDMASELPSKNFDQLIFESKARYYKILYNESKKSLSFLQNALKFMLELSYDKYTDKKFDRYIMSLSGMNVAVLKQHDSAGSVLKKAAEFFNVNVMFLSDKHNLDSLTPPEFSECKKADVIITCCVHGTKTHERDGVKCIDIWDILRDDSLTAKLPQPDKLLFSDFDSKLQALRSDLTKQLKASSDELAKVKEELNQLEQLTE